VPLLVPVIDIVVATAALLLYLRRNPSDGPFLGLLKFTLPHAPAPASELAVASGSQTPSKVP
jgi:hypothetical protein